MQFYIKGVDYQPGGAAGFDADNDPLGNPDLCLRDAYAFQQLGINAIRVYSTDMTNNHGTQVRVLQVLTRIKTNACQSSMPPAFT